jgi:hypothetical protein
MRKLASVPVVVLLMVLLSAGPGGAAPMAENLDQCPSVYFIGLHGLGQGPAEDAPDRPWSAEMITTGEAFNAAKPEGVTIEFGLIQYPVADDIYNSPGVVDTGVQRLDAAIRNINSRCPDQYFVLAGYSMGAWVIYKWRLQTAYLDQVLGIMLYGDPQYHREYGRDSHGNVLAKQGVGRLAVPLSGFALPLPYEPKDLVAEQRWASRCLSDDPICGEGEKYADNGASHTQQVIDAESCQRNPCPHHQYVASGWTEEGGQMLAGMAFPGVG